MPPGGRDSANKRAGHARRKFLIKPLKETYMGVAQAFLDPLKETMVKHRRHTYFYIVSSATLNEAFTEVKVIR